jgi:hypothetical protein
MRAEVDSAPASVGSRRVVSVRRQQAIICRVRPQLGRVRSEWAVAASTAETMNPQGVGHHSHPISSGCGRARVSRQGKRPVVTADVDSLVR